MAQEEWKEMRANWKGKRRWEVYINTTSWSAKQLKWMLTSPQRDKMWSEAKNKAKFIVLWGHKCTDGLSTLYNQNYGVSCHRFLNSNFLILIGQIFPTLSLSNNNYSPSLFFLHILWLNHVNICVLLFLIVIKIVLFKQDQTNTV